MNNRNKKSELAIPQADRISRYRLLKAKHSCDILLVRLDGDFYDAYDDDAMAIAVLVGVFFTAVDANGHEVAWCAVPYFSVDRYADRLREAGQKVVLVDETGEQES